MSSRVNSIREFVQTKNRESMEVFERLGEADWTRPVYSTEGGGRWTVRDVLAHLADSEQGQLGQAQRIANGHPGVPPDFDLNRWNKRAVEKRADKSPAELLADVRDGYARVVVFLEGIAEDDLDKIGRHASGQDLSVEAILRHIAAHRATHVAEIEAALGS